MSYDNIWLLSATPLINRVLDMGGYLDLIWRDNVKKDKSETVTEPEDDEYDLEKDPYKQFPADDIDEHYPSLHLLSLLMFRSNVKAGDLDIMHIWVVLSPLMKILFIGCDMSDKIEYHDTQNKLQSIWIRSTTPKYHVATVELKMDKKTQVEHDTLYCPLIFRMEQCSGSGDGSGSKLSDGLQDNAQDLFSTG